MNVLNENLLDGFLRFGKPHGCEGEGRDHWSHYVHTMGSRLWGVDIVGGGGGGGQTLSLTVHVHMP